LKVISSRYCILGAGPAGIGTAWELAQNGESDVVIIDRNGQIGGLARTEDFDGNLFDVGPHRFFTANAEVDSLWHTVLGNDFQPVSRLTRILYKNKLFKYPVSAIDALPKMGMIEAVHALSSYLYARVAKNADESETFEQWVSAKFGDKLYKTFFKTYTEKVWGIPCAEIGAEWAAQRIKGLDLKAVIKNSLGLGSGGAKTLVDQFNYPVRGAGMMYERMGERVVEKGQTIMLNTEVRSVERDGDRVTAIIAHHPDEGHLRFESEHYVTSMPITHFVAATTPAFDADVLEAAEALYYRDHITVNLVIDGNSLFPDQWVYVHATDVEMARLANYNNFSSSMAAKKDTTVVSVEYFVFHDDDLWKKTDDELVRFGTEELERTGLVPVGSTQKGWIIRETESYPTYYLGFQEPYDKIKGAMDSLSNCTPVGRGGMYKYNNMDHSLYTGLLAGRNLVAGDRKYDLWQVNIDAEYHEAASVENETSSDS
jgi:protoporphyrinogen oxidase